MGSQVKAAEVAVLCEVDRLKLSDRSRADYRKGCEAVTAFCTQLGAVTMTAEVCHDFIAAQKNLQEQDELSQWCRRGRIRCAKLMLDFALNGQVVWRVFPLADGLSEPFAQILKGFAASVESSLAVSTRTWMSGDVRRFLRFLEVRGYQEVASVAVEVVRDYLDDVSLRRPGGVRNVIKSLRRFFFFLGDAGLSEVRIDGLLCKSAPERARAFRCFTPEETARLLASIQRESARGKRDYAIVVLAVVTGLRCCDIVSLRLDQIDWQHDEIRLVQGKTSRPIVLPLTAQAGNAIADWILHGRPETDACEVFVRVLRPYVRLKSSAGSSMMGRSLTAAGITHERGDGRTFHALRRTVGTRLVESGASLPLVAQILGHAQINSTRRYISLTSEQMRECCLPLDAHPCEKEGLS